MQITLTKKDIDMLKDIYMSIAYIENELTYEYALGSGKIDLALDKARDAMKKMQTVKELVTK